MSGVSFPTYVYGSRMKAHHSIAARFNFLACTHKHPKFDEMEIASVSHVRTYNSISSISYTYKHAEQLTPFTLYPDGVIIIEETASHSCMQAWLTEERGTQAVCQTCPFQLKCIAD